MQQVVAIRQLEGAEVAVVVGLQLVEAQIKVESITNQVEQQEGSIDLQVLVVFEHFVEVPTEQVAIAEHLAEAQVPELLFNPQSLFLLPTSYLVQP